MPKRIAMAMPATIAGFMMFMLEKIPRRTDSLSCSGYEFEVVDIDDYKVDQLLVTRVEHEDDDK